MSKPKLAYRRILLKLSGEALSGEQGFGIDNDTLSRVCGEIADIRSYGVEVAIVVGGGNFFRGLGASAEGFERASADYIGMLATVMNAIALQQGLLQAGVEARVQSAIPISPVVEPYVRLRALKHLDAGRVVIFAAGTGNPYFTTDTAASLRAAEIGADVLVKATKVDGVYDCDPMINATAKRYAEISYDEVLQQRLAVMDAAAIALCRDNNTCLRVMSLTESGNLQRMILGESIGTLVSTKVSD
jgi:uridylate kinase